MKGCKGLSKKKARRFHSWARAGIQILCFIFFPSAFTAAFAGVKYLVIQIGSGEQIAWTPFVAALAFLCMFTILFGRFFCGFACAFGSLGDAMHSLYLYACKKLKKKPLRLPQSWGKFLGAAPYLILTAMVLLCFWGVQGILQGMSPWETFSMLHAGNFKLGSHRIGVLALALLLIGMCIQERFFCRFLCPMGAIFSLLPVLPVFSLSRSREGCIPGCRACSKNCPASIELPDSARQGTAFSCFQCQKCVDLCPKGNIHCSLPQIKGSELTITLLKSAILIAMFLQLGI